MTLTRKTWSNGQPSLEFSPFKYDQEWFLQTAATLERTLQLKRVEDPTLNADTCSIEYFGEGGTVMFDMDHFNCALAFPSLEERQKAEAILIKDLNWQVVDGD